MPVNLSSYHPSNIAIVLARARQALTYCQSYPSAASWRLDSPGQTQPAVCAPLRLSGSGISQPAGESGTLPMPCLDDSAGQCLGDSTMV